VTVADACGILRGAARDGAGTVTIRGLTPGPCRVRALAASNRLFAEVEIEAGTETGSANARLELAELSPEAFRAQVSRSR
jgi:hypothetical protein